MRCTLLVNEKPCSEGIIGLLHYSHGTGISSSSLVLTTGIFKVLSTGTHHRCMDVCMDRCTGMRGLLNRCRLVPVMNDTILLYTVKCSGTGYGRYDTAVPVYGKICGG